jgi:aminoglycoside phosphotransferase (APT) family kinase protein
VLAVERMVAAAFPERRVVGHEILTGGLINTNLKVHLDGGFDPVVLRVYRDGPEVCRKELALHDLVKGEVPVAEIIYASTESSPAFAVLEYCEGLTFQQLKRTGDLEAIHQAAADVGKTLAAIGRFSFGDKVIEGPDQVRRILDRFLASPILQQRVSVALIDRLHNLIWSHAAELRVVDEDRSLVHNDFGNRNILVHQRHGSWRVAAILDWELAFRGSPLLDVGHFLRYESPAQPLREPHFSRAFIEHGGKLPDNWQRIVKLIDLTGLVECLTHEQLPHDVEAELLALIEATLRMA